MILNVDPQLTQWDVGRSVSISDSNATHIHFANPGDSKAPIIEITNGSAKIPDYLLQTGKNVIAYAVLDGVTLESKSFPVRKRERPENYVYEEDQRNFIYELIANAEGAVKDATLATSNANNAADSANNAADSANIATQNANVAAAGASDASAKANLAAENANEATVKTVNAVKNMMVVGGEKGEIISLDNAIDQTLVGLRVFGKTTQDGTPTPDAPVGLVSAGDGGNIGVIVCGKNLLKNKYARTTTTSNGITFTHNADGTIIVNGTSTGRAQTNFFTLTLPAGTYILSQGYTGDVAKQPVLFAAFYKADEPVWVVLSGTSEKTITLEESTELSVVCEVRTAGESYTNFMVYPMLRLSSVKDDTFEPYKGQTLAVSTPIGLPGIPVTAGGNYTDTSGQQWICDEIDFERGKLIVRILSEAITGTPQFVETPDWAGRFVFNNCLSTFCKSGRDNALSSFAKFETWGYGYAGECFAINSRSLYYNPETTMTADEVSAMFADMIASETPPVILAQLATPIEIPLSDEELAAYAALRTYKDHTTVLNDASAYMELEYVMDAKKYIDGLFAGTIIPATVE